MEKITPTKPIIDKIEMSMGKHFLLCETFLGSTLSQTHLSHIPSTQTLLIHIPAVLHTSAHIPGTRISDFGIINRLGKPRPATPKT